MIIERKRTLINMNSTLAEIPPDWLHKIEPHVVRGGYLPCWIWAGPQDKNGEALMKDKWGSQRLVKKTVMEMFYEFPEWYYIQIKCRNRSCVNPNHMVIMPKRPKYPGVGRPKKQLWDTPTFLVHRGRRSVNE